MASTSEIRRRIGSVRQTQKITHAMYLISQAKLRKAKQDLSNTRPYFDALQAEIGRVFNADDTAESRYLYAGSPSGASPSKRAFSTPRRTPPCAAPARSASCCWSGTTPVPSTLSTSSTRT